jgi:hypothetical protein
VELRNKTPLVAGWTVVMDKAAAEHLVLCVRGTWSLDEKGRLALVKDPPPLLPMHVHVGEPGLSSIRYEADIGPVKPATDCALVGSAVAPKGGKAGRVTVAFRVGPVARRAVVTGERKRLFWFLRWWDSPVKPFTRVPLTWELAAGGTDTTPANEKRHSRNERNPYGRGFRARGSKLPVAGALLPQIITPGGCMPFGRAKEPAGFGLTGNEFLHRRPYAGTYDEAWVDEQCPLLPEDFDTRFHCCAAPGLSTEEPLVGGEPVEVSGCTRNGRLAFQLPQVRLDVSADLGDGTERIPMAMQTVTVDTDEMQLRVLWRGELNVHGRLPRLKRMDVAAKGIES